jgi:glutaredoxin
LEKQGIDFKNIDVGEDKDALQEMFDKSGQMGVPVFDINGDILLDFNESQLKEKLGLN